MKFNLFIVNVLTRSGHHRSIAVHKVFSLIAIKNNINIKGGSFVNPFKPRRRDDYPIRKVFRPVNYFPRLENENLENYSRKDKSIIVYIKW